MSLDEVIEAVCTAVQPFIDRDTPNPRGVKELTAEIKQIFVEEPAMQHAFTAAVVAIATEARKGWRPNE